MRGKINVTIAVLLIGSDIHPVNPRASLFAELSAAFSKVITHARQRLPRRLLSSIDIYLYIYLRTVDDDYDGVAMRASRSQRPFGVHNFTLDNGTSKDLKTTWVGTQSIERKSATKT